MEPSSSSSSRQTTDAQLYEQLMQQHATNIILEPHIFRLDANQAMGAEMKLLRQTIATTKKQIVEVCAPLILPSLIAWPISLCDQVESE